MSETAAATTITDHEAEQIRRANESGRPPAVFIHGLWLLPSSWDRWAGEGVTEIVEIKGRGHALTIDSGWREVADTALAFVKRFA